MLKSMTGFGAGKAEDEDFKVSVEIKAVNQRYLEQNFHMGAALNAMEPDLRAEIAKHAARGKLDIYIDYVDRRESEREIHVNEGLARAYQTALNEISDVLRMARPDDVVAIAGYPDVLQIENTGDVSAMEPLLLAALREALGGLDAMRRKEGAHIEQDFEGRLKTLEGDVAALRELAPKIVDGYRSRLQKTLSELIGDKVDETRLIEETALYADKVNFTEEVVRLDSHFAQFGALIRESGEPVGRKLDFLIQEMNRETNTIGSKANSAEAAQVVVAMKSEIEKLREQVQNIE